MQTTLVDGLVNEKLYKVGVWEPGDLVITAPHLKHLAKQKKKSEAFIQVKIKTMRKLAEATRTPVFAVVAELLHKRFQSDDKAAPVKLSNANLKLSHRAKKKALDLLQKIGAVTVQSNPGVSPLVKILDL